MRSEQSDSFLVESSLVYSFVCVYGLYIESSLAFAFICFCCCFVCVGNCGPCVQCQCELCSADFERDQEHQAKVTQPLRDACPNFRLHIGIIEGNETFAILVQF